MTVSGEAALDPHIVREGLCREVTCKLTPEFDKEGAKEVLQSEGPGKAGGRQETGAFGELRSSCGLSRVVENTI